MPDEVCRAELGSKIASCVSYAISGGLVMGQEILAVFDAHATGIAGILGCGTFIINWYYQKKLSECRCRVLGIDRRQHTCDSHPHRRLGDPLKERFDE